MVRPMDTEALQTGLGEDFYSVLGIEPRDLIELRHVKQGLYP